MWPFHSNKELSISEYQAKIILLEAEIVKLKTQFEALDNTLRSLRGYVYKKKGIDIDKPEETKDLTKAEGIIGFGT